MLTSTEVRATGSLEATDRCDRCVAPAQVRVILASGGELVFCEHHARLHRAALEPIAARIEHRQSTLNGSTRR